MALATLVALSVEELRFASAAAVRVIFFWAPVPSWSVIEASPEVRSKVPVPVRAAVAAPVALA